MKLLYVWIEEFRNIHKQGVVIDNEFTIEIKEANKSFCDYYTNDRIQFTSATDTPKCGEKVFNREIVWAKNNDYPVYKVDVAINSIAALVGKNATGKSSILECISSQGQPINDGCSYFLAFFNPAENCIEIRSRGINIISEKIFEYSRKPDGYVVYIIPLKGDSQSAHCEPFGKTFFHFLSPQKDARPYSEYSVMGIPTIVGDLDAFDNDNAFEGVFDFLCDFPNLVSDGNKLVVFLDVANGMLSNDYFKKPNLTCVEYKRLYIYRLAQILFSNLLTYLYHPTPRFMANGTRERLPNEEILKEEDVECAELLSFFNREYPQEGSVDLISYRTGHMPKDEIQNAIKFFRKSTFSYSGKSIYDKYIKNIEELFETLFVADDNLFSAIFKIEIPFQIQYKPIVSALQKCIDMKNVLEGDWVRGLNIRFEHFSSGEHHLAMLFSAVYQRMKKLGSYNETRDIIWAIDEPEMHMHPELGRNFIDELNKAMLQYKKSGLLKTCQFIFATHSPFIIQSLGNYTSRLTLVDKAENQTITKTFDELPQLKFPNRKERSFNLIMYKIFEVPTVELHNELYGILQEMAHCYGEKEFETWLGGKGIFKSKKWVKEVNGQPDTTKPVTIETFIRNSIHHPENRSNSGGYSAADLKKSIEEMISLLYKKGEKENK
jgi:hypothetical protein